MKLKTIVTKLTVSPERNFAIYRMIRELQKEYGLSVSGSIFYLLDCGVTLITMQNFSKNENIFSKVEPKNNEKPEMFYMSPKMGDETGTNEAHDENEENDDTKKDTSVIKNELKF